MMMNQCRCECPVPDVCVPPTAALRIRAAGRRDMGGARTLHVRNDDR